MDQIDEKVDFLLKSINARWQYHSAYGKIINDRIFLPDSKIACIRSFGAINTNMNEIKMIFGTHTVANPISNNMTMIFVIIN